MRFGHLQCTLGSSSFTSFFFTKKRTTPDETLALWIERQWQQKQSTFALYQQT
jgi:hypothetical protein